MQDKIYLKPLSLNDINKKYLSWVNDPSITEYLEIGKQSLKYEDLVRYVEDSPKKGRKNYAVITKNSKHHIGNCSIFSIKPNKKNFEIGWFIGEKKFWGGHYSSMIIFYLLKIGFIEMGLERCTGYVDKKNIKARMTNKFSGYKEKERENRVMKKENKTLTYIKLEITKKEWLKNARKLHTLYPELYIV
jgi:RimJ/RimL family protein N-acetyltransferase